MQGQPEVLKTCLEKECEEEKERLHFSEEFRKVVDLWRATCLSLGPDALPWEGGFQAGKSHYLISPADLPSIYSA